MPQSDTNTTPVTLTVGLDEVEEFPIDFGDGVIRRIAISQSRCERGGDARRRITVRPVVGGETVVGMKRDQGRM